jgi:hypothetical protein
MASNPPEKKTEAVRVWLEPSLELELRRNADFEGRSLSEYIARELRVLIFGKRMPRDDEGKGSDRTDSDR